MSFASNSNDFSTKIPSLPRPIFDGLTSEEDKFKAAMAEYELLKGPDQDGLDFSNKTAMWVAYERQVESERDDSLFNDTLAGHFVGQYGKRLSDAMSFGLAFSCFDPPGAGIGLGLEGHVMYTAARTKLVNDQVDRWIMNQQKQQNLCQVLNLGVGMDTRVYWLESLKHSKFYWEIDTSAIMNYKQDVLDRLQDEGELPEAMCERKPIAMDFSKESIADLPRKYGYDCFSPTCWILEGLIMYLQRNAVEQLMDDVSTLSAPGSMIILNFSNSNSNDTTACPSIDEIDARLEGQKWSKEQRLMFGEKGFNFGRYPQGKPANTQLGFAMYKKL